MKINKVISLIVIFFMALFSVSLEVDAAQELTCMYKKEATANKVLLLQESNGDIKVFTNNKDEDITDFGWILQEQKKYEFEDNVSLASDGSLASCPVFINTGLITRKIVFSNVDGNGSEAVLDNGKSGNVVQYPSNVVSNSDLNAELSKEDTCSNDSWIKDLDTSKYSGVCLYKGILENGNCHLVQINYGKNAIETVEYDPVKGLEYSSIQSTSGPYSQLYLNLQLTRITAGFKVGFTLDEFLDYKNGDCLVAIKVNRDVKLNDDLSLEINTDVYLASMKGDTYYLVNNKGENPVTGEKLVMGGDTNISIGKKQIENCADLLGEDAAELLGIVWNVVKILVPLILLVLGTLDFAKAIFSGNEDGMKKAQAKFIKRVIIAVVIFLIPSLLGFILGVANGIWGNIGTDICGILA